MNGQSTLVEKEEENLAFENFPAEVMLMIFKYCSDITLCNMSKTCKRFNGLINDFVWHQRSRRCLATNQQSEEIRKRSYHMLSGGNKCRISVNWIIGRYRERSIPLKERYMPWLLLDSRTLWMSKGKRIQAFHRKMECLSSKPVMSLEGQNADVCRFAMTDGLIVAGGRDGVLCGWSSQGGDLKFRQREICFQEVRAVDISSKYHIVSGSSGGAVSVWKVCPETWDCKLVHSLLIDEGIWSVAISSSNNAFCLGSNGFHKKPLHLYDVERIIPIELHASHRFGAGVLDIHWETPYTFLSAGYDTYLRLWDIRVGRQVQAWEDPFDSAIYCIGSDNMYTMLCGTALNRRVQLWDKRLSQSVQKYFVKAIRSSPVYSLAFDPSYLYTALDTSLHMLDFSAYKNSPDVVHPAKRWIF